MGLVLVGLVILFAVIVKFIAFDLNSMPASSMSPTLNPGQNVFVNKTAYWFSSPERGDVVTFWNEDTVFVKRLIGLAGDTVQMKDGDLYLNGEKQQRTQIEDFTKDGRPVPQYVETLTGGRSFKTLDLQPGSFMDNTAEYRVPENSYFVLGDNRDNSTDSRLQSAIGYVAESAIIGRVSFIYWDDAMQEPEYTPVN